MPKVSKLQGNQKDPLVARFEQLQKYYEARKAPQASGTPVQPTKPFEPPPQNPIRECLSESQRNFSFHTGE